MKVTLFGGGDDEGDAVCGGDDEGDAVCGGGDEGDAVWWWW